MIINYRCKFCHVGRSVELVDGVDMFQVEKWKPLLACNRCADYQEGKRGLVQRILNATFHLIAFRRSGNTKATEPMLREKLTELTKRLAALVCRHYQKANVWDVEFVNLLMDRPEASWKICRDYERHIESPILHVP